MELLKEGTGGENLLSLLGSDKEKGSYFCLIQRVTLPQEDQERWFVIIYYFFFFKGWGVS